MDIDRDALKDICNRAAEIAKDAYIRLPNGQVFPKKLKRKLDKLETISLQNHHNVLHDCCKDIDLFEEQLREIGFSKVLPVGYGDQATFFIAQKGNSFYGLRFSLVGFLGGGDRVPVDFNAPHYKQLKTEDSRVEIMPVFHTTEAPFFDFKGYISPLSKQVFSPLTKDLETIRSWSPLLGNKDFYILPDGTIGNLDPGPLSIKRNADTEQVKKDIKEIEKRIRDLGPMPEQLRWRMPDGTLKQDHFFPSPF